MSPEQSRLLAPELYQEIIISWTLYTTIKYNLEPFKILVRYDVLPRCPALSLSTPKAGISSSEHTTYASLDEPTDNRSTNSPEADVPVLRAYRVCPTRFCVAVPAKSDVSERGIEGEVSE